MSVIQFACDIMCNIGQTDENEAEKMQVDDALINTNDFIEKKMNGLANLIQLIDEINIFNPLEDENNDNIFKEWSKSVISQILLQKKRLKLKFYKIKNKKNI